MAASEKYRNYHCPHYPFSLDPDEKAEKHIGRLSGLDSFLLKYQIRVASDAVKGENELDLLCTTGYNIWTPVVVDISVNSTKPEFAVGSINSLPPSLKANTDNMQITLEIQNVGEGDAKLATAELRLPEGFHPSTSFSNKVSLGTLKRESVKEARFEIDTDEVKAGVHQALLVIHYKTDDNNVDEYRTETIGFDLNIKPSPNMKIQKVIVPPNLSQGQTGELRLRVVNEGEETAKGVSVKVFKDSQNIPIDFREIFDFIGDIDAGKTGDAVFDFSIDRDAVLKEYLLKTEIRFIDDDTVRTETVTVPLVISQEQATFTVVYIVVVILIIAGLIYWKKQ